MSKYNKITLPYWEVNLPTFKDEVQHIERETYPLTTKEWRKPKIAKKQKEVFFIHFETDIEDDSLGIDINNAKRLFEMYQTEEIIELFRAVNLIFSLSPNLSERLVDEDGFIDWDNFSLSLIREKDEVIPYLLRLIDNIVIPESVRFESLSFSDINQDLIATIKSLIEFESLDVINPELSIDSIIESRKKLWMESAAGRAPQINGLLLANPKNFSKKFINKIKEVYGNDLISLDKSVQMYIGTLLNNLGENICHFKDNDIIISGIGTIPFHSEIECKVIPKKLFLSFSDSISNSINGLKVLGELNEEELGFIYKKGSMSDSDLKTFRYKRRFYSEVNPSYHNLFDELSFSNWKLVQRYGEISSPAMTPSELLQAINLYTENKNNKQNIPIISGKVGSYEYKMLKKSDILGLFLGYATDCCMVFGGEHNSGRSCLVAGYTREDSAFFVVTKGNTIYAQSWCWENKKLFCFDSLEVLGKHSGNYSPDIIKCYQEASLKLIEEGYKEVTLGADGNETPDAIIDSGLEIYHRAPEKYLCPFENVYSDIDYVESRDEEDAIKLIVMAKKDKKVRNEK